MIIRLVSPCHAHAHSHPHLHPHMHHPHHTRTTPTCMLGDCRHDEAARSMCTGRTCPSRCGCAPIAVHIPPQDILSMLPHRAPPRGGSLFYSSANRLIAAVLSRGWDSTGVPGKAAAVCRFGRDRAGEQSVEAAGEYKEYTCNTGGGATQRTSPA